METMLHICYKCIGDLGTVHSSSLVGGSVSVSHYMPRLIYSIGLLVVSLTLPITLPQDTESSDRRLGAQTQFFNWNIYFLYFQFLYIYFFIETVTVYSLN